MDRTYEQNTTVVDDFLSDISSEDDKTVDKTRVTKLERGETGSDKENKVLWSHKRTGRLDCLHIFCHNVGIVKTYQSRKREPTAGMMESDSTYTTELLPSFTVSSYGILCSNTWTNDPIWFRRHDMVSE